MNTMMCRSVDDRRAKDDILILDRTSTTTTTRTTTTTTTSLNLRHFRVGPSILQTLHCQEKHPHLRELYLGPSFSSQVTIASIVSSLPPVKVLDLDLTRITERRSSTCAGGTGGADSATTKFSWQHELQGLLEGLPSSVEQLSLRLPNHSHNNNNTTLTTTRATSEQDVAVVALARAFRNTTTKNNQSLSNLKSLDLRDNHMGDTGAIALAEALPHAPHLRTVILSWNAIGSSGAKALAEALPLTHLEKLDLSGNQNLLLMDTSNKNKQENSTTTTTTTTTVMHAFCRGLENNECLKELNLANIRPGITLIDAERLLDCLKYHNVTLERINIANPTRPTRHDPRAVARTITTSTISVITVNGNDHSAAQETQDNKSRSNDHQTSLETVLRHIDYFLSLNRAGRRLVKDRDEHNNKQVPNSLWPLVLAKIPSSTTNRAGSSRNGAAPAFVCDSSRKAPNELYFFLRHNQDLFRYRNSKSSL